MTMIETNGDTSFFWPLLDRYRDPDGRTLSTLVENAASVPRPESELEALMSLIALHKAADDRFTYAEIGIGFGTTFAMVLGTFPRSFGYGLEAADAKFNAAWETVASLADQWNLDGRFHLMAQRLDEVKFAEASLDVVLLNAPVEEQEGQAELRRLLESRWLSESFLVIGAMETRTEVPDMVERFHAEHADRYSAGCSPTDRLWWFTPLKS